MSARTTCDLFTPPPRKVPVMHPHAGYRLRGRDPRLVEYLAVLAEVLAGDDHEALLRVLCGGVWWLDHDRAGRLAVELKRLLGVEGHGDSWEG